MTSTSTTIANTSASSHLFGHVSSPASPKSVISEDETPASYVPVKPERDDDIFERSLGVSPYQSLVSSRRNLRVGVPIGRSLSVVSTGSNSYKPLFFNTEDFVAPVLDSTTEIITDPTIDLNKVNIVYCDCGEPVCRTASNTSPRKCPKNKSRPRSRSRSRLFVCASLMSALHPSPADVESEGEASAVQETPELGADGLTINFYSFADVLNGEQDPDTFSTLRMSNYLSST